MHAFALVLKSCIDHPWAKDLIVAAQQVVTYFRASHQPLGKLYEQAKHLKIPTTLKSSNTTRLTSVFIMLDSVLRLENAFRNVMVVHPDLIKNAQVEATLCDLQTWSGLRALLTVLEPIADVVMAAQASNSTLADMTRYWLYTARAMESASGDMTVR